MPGITDTPLTPSEQVIYDWLRADEARWLKLTTQVTTGFHDPDYLVAHDIRGELNRVMMQEIPYPSIWSSLIISALHSVDYYKIARLITAKSS